MKRFFALFCILVALCLLLVGCVDPAKRKPSDDPDSDNTNTAQFEQPSNDGGGQKEIAEMFVTINGNKLKVDLADNSSVDALVEILKKGDITYTADDYGNFEKVGDIGYTLPRNDTHISTQAGDVILYQGCNICLYYGANSYSFTRIGKINGYTERKLRALLGAGKGSVQVIISLK